MALAQPLHIFRKDVLHLWPETLVTLLLLLAFAWLAPHSWHESEYSPYLQILSGLLHVLIPISWLVVIARLVHDESLVGDRQFWTSRPYRWGLLLAAKLLYLVVFLYLPFFLMQVYLLKHAGLYPTTALPALLHNLLLLSVIFIVPLTAIAAVTSTFARLLLSFVGAVLYVLIVFGVYFFLVFRRMPAPHLSVLIFSLLTVLPAAALLYQYATRRTAVSRTMLLATPVLVVLILALTPASAMIRSAYPQGNGSDLPQLSAFAIPAGAKTGSGAPVTMRDSVFLQVPFTVTDHDRDSNYVIQGIAPSLSGGGTTWSEGYQAVGAEAINAGAPIVLLHVAVPKAVFDKVHSSPVDMHLSVVADHMKAGASTTWKSSAAPFAIPDHGVCTYESSEDRTSLTPVCRFALQTPDYLVVAAPLSPGTCASAEGQQVRGSTLLSRPSTFSFDPVVQVPLNLRAGGTNPQQSYSLCAGTPMEFVEAKPAGKIRLELDDKGLMLDPLVQRIQAPSAGASGEALPQ